jgi:hypothetical protein
MTEVREPGAECSTGQERPYYSKREPRKKEKKVKKILQSKRREPGKKEERYKNISQNYQKEKLEHLPMPP